MLLTLQFTRQIDRRRVVIVTQMFATSGLFQQDSLAAATFESIALGIRNGPRRQLLAKWHPILDQHQKANLPETNWPNQQATHCRQDFEAARQAILASTRQLGEWIGV